MDMHRVTVIDGPLPEGVWQTANMEPSLVTAPEHTAVLRELMDREPLFHRPEFGTTRADFERMTAPEFWEVGASGRRYGRQFCLDTLERRTSTRRRTSGRWAASTASRSPPTTTS